MSELPYGPPVRVSPLIRFGRWSFLATGILYGAFHQSRLSKKEAVLREIEAKEKPIREEKLRKEKAIAAAELVPWTKLLISMSIMQPETEIKALEEMVAPKQ